MRLRRGIRRGAAVALLSLGTAVAGRGQTPSAPQAHPAPSSFTGSAQVLSVDVPVQVVRDGEPVRGLQAGDFAVWEGHRRLPVTGFEVLDLAATGAGRASPVPSAARRHFLMLFDLAFSEPKAIVRARRAAAGLLADLHPTDLVAVATYSASRGPQLVLGFTSDRRQLQSALGGLGLFDLTASSADPLRLVLQEVLGVDNVASGAAPRVTRDPLSEATDSGDLTRIEAITRQVELADRTALKTRVVTFSKSLADLARQMSVVEGRKYLVFLSEGFDVSLLQGTVDAEKEQTIHEQSLNGESWRTSPEERYGLTEVSNAVERMLEEFRRADCTLQAVDIGGLRAGADQGAPRLGGRESLLLMARGTGGELYESYNDLGAAMGQMLKRTSVTYVLAIQPERSGAEGDFHRLRVDLEKPVHGARLVHRPGYYPPKPYAEQDPIEKLLAAANQVMSGEESDAIAASVLAAPFRASGEKAYVPVVIEVGGPTLLAGRQPASLPVEIYAYALDEGGAVHDFFTQTVGLDLTKAGALLRQGGLKFFGHLDLQPGDYSLRVLVRNAASGVSGLKVAALHVPAFGPAEPVLLPPFVPEPPNRWLMVREQQRGEGPAPAYPFLLRNQPFVPAARPELPPGREVRLVVAGYNLGAAPWKGEATVIAADGRETPAGGLEIADRRAGADGGADRAVATFRLPADLKPGEYTLRVSVSGAASALRFVVPGARARG
ncbi:MAG TPA: VWA domain-containing protein [Thermoanaerobaculia bacterium]